MEDLRVLVVSDDPLARTGLALLLADRGGIAVSGRGRVCFVWTYVGDMSADIPRAGPERQGPTQIA